MTTPPPPPPPPPPPALAAPEKLAKTALVDSYGRSLCYAYIHGLCKTTPCPKGRYHGKETEAMKTKRVADEKKMAERKAAGNSGSQSDIETADKKKAAGKAKAKAKGKVKP